MYMYYLFTKQGLPVSKILLVKTPANKTLIYYKNETRY